MRQRWLSCLGTDVPEFALGCWGISGDGYGPVPAAEADAVVARAVGLGIRVFDTADVYANGEMERRLAAQLRGLESQTVVVTRIGTDRSNDPPHKRFDAAYLREAVQRSCDRLGRRPLDLCLLHNPTAATLRHGEAVALLRELQESGSVRAWGVSAGNREVALAAVDSGAQVLSVAYNIFHARDLHAVAAEVAARGVGVLAHSVLAYGLLTCHWSEDRSFGSGDHRRDRWSDSELRSRMQQLFVLRGLVGGDVLTPRGAAVRFVLANTLVTCAVLGPRTVEQLDQLVREAGQGPPYLPDSVLARLPSQLINAGLFP